MGEVGFDGVWVVVYCYVFGGWFLLEFEVEGFDGWVEGWFGKMVGVLVFEVVVGYVVYLCWDR